MMEEAQKKIIVFQKGYAGLRASLEKANNAASKRSPACRSRSTEDWLYLCQAFWCRRKKLFERSSWAALTFLVATMQPAAADDTSSCRSGSIDEQIVACSNMIKRGGAAGWVYFWRGNAYRVNGKYDLAISDLDFAIYLDAKNANAFASRGSAYFMKSNYVHASPDFDQAIRLDPKNTFALASRGVAYNLQEKYDRAISDFDEAIRLSPKYAFAFAYRGEAYRRTGRLDSAISDFDEAIRLDPKNAVANSGRDEALRQKSTPSIVPISSLGRRVALVIGNGSYSRMPPLRNPVNDAGDVGEELKRLGFDVQVELNVDRARLNEVIGVFSNKVAGANVAIFYYAGHGMQFQGKNYLLPVETDLQSSADVNRFKLLLVDDIIDVLAAASGLQMVVLDACRNNPREQEFKNKIASLSPVPRDGASSRGMLRIERGGLLLAYATTSNTTADDGDGRNSPFTKAFITNLKKPDLEVRQMLFRVQSDVYRATEMRQLPEISSLYVGPDVLLQPTNQSSVKN